MILRTLGWTLFAGSAAGFVYDEVHRAKSRFADLVTGGLGHWAEWHRQSHDWVSDHVSGLVTQAGLGEATTSLLDLPAFPVMIVLGVLILWLTGASGSELRPIDIVRRPERTDGPAPRRTVPVPSAAQARGAPAVAPGMELRSALVSVRSAFLGVAVFSGFVNILMLTGSFFMLEVYDRVLPSRSVPTLVGLSLLALLLFAMMGGIDFVRTRMLTRIGGVLDETVSGRVHDAVMRLPLKVAQRNDGLQPLRDLDTVRSFLGGLGPTALFDMPWVPLYIGIIYLFHPLLGLVAIAGAIILVSLTLLTEVFTSKAARKASEMSLQQNGLADASRRNAEVVSAMGMGGVMQARWQAMHRSYVASQGRASDVALGFGAFSKVLRMVLQSGVLALGAYLVIHGEATAGIIIAGSILVSRALAPIELAIANWRGFVASRQSWNRINQLLKLLPPEPEPLALPAPQQSLSVEGLTGGPPGATKAVVQDVTFKLQAGDGLAIMGPSASGKSTLVRMLVGVWRGRGAVRLDGATIEQWSNEDLGRVVGYLPQDVELFSGTVAENIARFDPDAQPEAIIAAAKAAGAHDMIVGLSDGYDTHIGDHGSALSAGTQQRVALARALYGDPFLIVLDEPNSNLDADGEAALTQAIMGARGRGAIVIVVAHRPSALAALGHVLAIYKGRPQAFGPKEEVLPKILRPATAATGPGQGPGPGGLPRVASVVKG